MNSTVKLHADCPATPECPGDDGTLHRLWHEGELDECEKGLRAVLSACPLCPDANIQLVACLIEQERHEEGDALVEDLLPRASGDDELSSLLGHKGALLAQCLGSRAAMPWFSAAAQVDPDPHSLGHLAMAMWDQRRTKRAGEFAERALVKLPFDPAVIGQCVDILVKTGRIDTARRQLLALAERDYDVAQYHLAVAQGLILAGLEQKGLAVGRRAAKRYPESLGVACVVSQLLLKAQKPKPAAPLLRRALRLDPAGHGKYALMNLAQIAGETGDIEGMLRTAVQANVEFNDPDTRRLLRNTLMVVTSQVREREAALQKLATDHARVKSKHESLEAALAGYDPSEGGTNLEYALGEGEGWHIEFMERMPDQARDLGIEIAALSSQTGGGTIFLGVRDNGDVVGSGDARSLRQHDHWRHRIAQIATKVVQPPNPVTVYFNERDNVTVIKVWVPEGSAPIYYVDNIPVIRNLDESRKATPEEVAEYVARRSSSGGRNGH